jgi:uncharacterized small protein (DUF1192 family)
VIRRRSSQKGKDVRPDGEAPAPFFNFTDDRGPAEETPLFNLEELHERRILSWSPEPDEAFDEEGAESEPTREEREERARSAYDYEPSQGQAAPELRLETPPVSVAPAPEPERVAPAPRAEAAVAPPRPAVPAPVREPERVVAPPVVSAESEPDDGTVPAVVERGPKRRGRPRGRPRRQVHFHVDPDEERLLMAAVERYGSQQKGLIAALESLQEADFLRDEIERLRAEVDRHRRMLDQAESLFKR